MAVQTETYANIVERVEALMGDDLTTRELTRLKALINRRARYAYKLYDNWPSFFVAKKARRLQANKGIEHVHLDYVGADFGVDHIDEVLRVWQKEPFVDTGSQETFDSYYEGDVTFPVGADYVYVDLEGLRFDTGTAWGNGVLTVETETPHGLKIGDPFKITDTLSPGGSPSTGYDGAGVVYFVSTTTNFGVEVTGAADVVANGLTGSVLIPYIYAAYRARYVGNYGDGDGETSTIPHEWAEYLVQAAYSDFLRADGQSEKAGVEERMAHEVLQEEMLRHDRRMSQHQVITKLRTHGTQAFR